MEYLQGVLERIVPGYQQIAEAAVREVLFAPSLFKPASLDNDNCLVFVPQSSQRVAFLAETRGGRTLQTTYMDLIGGRPSAVLANFLGHIEYIPASVFYYQDYPKLQAGIATAARRFAHRANIELLRLLCRARTTPASQSNRPGPTIRQLIMEMQAAGRHPKTAVVPAGYGLLPGEYEPLNIVQMGGLRRIVMVDTGTVGLFAGGSLRVLMGAHSERNAYWVIAGCYMNAVVLEPKAVRWSRVPR